MGARLDRLKKKGNKKIIQSGKKLPLNLSTNKERKREKSRDLEFKKIYTNKQKQRNKTKSPTRNSLNKENNKKNLQ